MKLQGRRESTNVEDRRGSSGSGMGMGTKIGLGGCGGGSIIAIIIFFIMNSIGGGNSGFSIPDIFQNILNGNGFESTNMGQSSQAMAVEQGTFTEEEEQLATFAKQIMGSTEDIWAQIFKEYGLGEYPAPTLVLYTGQTSTACGTGTAAVGPFYCSGDQRVYLDLSFFQTMDQQLGIKGDNASLAKAYVIAHEVGHHIEYLTGTLQKAHDKMQRKNQTESNKLSVRLELMADFYAGVWAHYENKYFNSISDQDLLEAIDCAQKIGDDYLQKRSQGRVTPESFTHGTSAQRMKWFKLGYETGDVRKATQFQESDATL